MNSLLAEKMRQNGLSALTMNLSKVYVAIFGLGLLAIAGCGPGRSSNESKTRVNSSLAGTVVIEGSSTVEPIAIRGKETFNQQHPQVSVSISGKGTGNGIAALIKGEADMASASRPIKLVEFRKMGQAKLSFYEIPIAYDGLTFVVNRSNDFVKQLTMEQLTRIFREGDPAGTWSEVDPSWPNQPITIYAPGIASGSHDYFVEMMGRRDGQGMRSDERITLSEDDKLLVRGVKEDKYAIGFFGFAYYLAERENLQVVKIVDSQGVPIEPSRETILSGAYPFSRPLFFYISANSYRRIEVSEFVQCYLSQATSIVEQAGFIPLPADIYARCFDRLESGAQGTGTHFIDSQGQTRAGFLPTVYQAENLTRE